MIIRFCSEDAHNGIVCDGGQKINGRLNRGTKDIWDEWIDTKIQVLVIKEKVF